MCLCGLIMCINYVNTKHVHNIFLTNILLKCLKFKISFLERPAVFTAGFNNTSTKQNYLKTFFLFQHLRSTATLLHSGELIVNPGGGVWAVLYNQPFHFLVCSQEEFGRVGSERRHIAAVS